MKGLILGLSLLMLVGCAGEPVRNILRDPQFDEYKTTLDELESDYLQKKITYAEYLDKKKAVEEGYQKTIDDRRQGMQDDDVRGAVNEMTP